MGDSIAAGVGDPATGYPDEPWASLLVAALERAVVDPVAHRNVAARDLCAAEVRVQQLDEVVAFAPDLVILTAGGNDMLRRSFAPEQVEDELEVMVGTFAGAGATIATFGLIDISGSPFVPDAMRDDLRRRLRGLNRVVGRVCRSYGGVHVDMADHPIVSDRTAWSADGIHPNRKGQAMVLAALVRGLGQHLALRRAS